MSGGGAKPAGLKRSFGIGQDAVLGPRPRRRFKSRNARFAPRAGLVVAPVGAIINRFAPADAKRSFALI